MGRIRPFRHKRRWIWVLAIIAAACCLATTVVFSPGYMSPDTIYQLKQAMGEAPVSDWHPPVMSLVWHVLIAVTGTPASMAVVQSIVFWATLWVIAWCVWDLTSSRPGSLAVLGLGLTPHVLTFVGVVWKDVHMAFALLVTTAVALVGQRLRAGRPALRWALLGLGVLFLVYAVLVRKNAIFAAIPVFVMLVLALWRKPGRRIWVTSTAALVLGLVVSTAAISSIVQPVRTSQGSTIMLDDLLHVLSVKELQSAAVSPDLRDRLVASAKKCDQTDSLSDSYYKCYERGKKGLVADSNQITSLWTSEMAGHFPGYLAYRLQVFSELLFKSRYQYMNGIITNDLGLKVSHPRLEDSLQTYVDGAVGDMPLLFTGWFWLAVALVMSIRPGRGRFSMPIRALGVSSAAYVFGYLPILPVSIYRYIYWPAIAGTLGLLLYWLGRATSPAVRHEAETLPRIRPVETKPVVSRNSDSP
jgi:hypothetical protein